MKIVNFFVLFCFIINGRSFRVRYCEICDNHTLCKYPKDGPSPNCFGYKMSPLTTTDAQDIVDKINERRHLVAMGSLNGFPQAANMKKLKWSSKLAYFAQRWADQCDQSINPDLEDECRDLANIKVGQSIATVVGPSPGLSVKSFVEIWFMLNLDFTGNVAYYNQSKDSKTNYFSQLIWAETAAVGCGRAKFFNNKLNTVMERVVCNFAPKGNVHGKPIYAIGYPGTQCFNQTKPDVEYTGLCPQNVKGASFNDKVSSANSLLRILNLSDPLKQELDPTSLRQIYLNNSKTSDQRNQRTRNAYPNDSYGAIKRDSLHFQKSMTNENYNDQPQQHNQQQFTQERGHSRMYHGYQTTKEPLFNLDLAHVHTETDFRRTFTTSAPFYTDAVQDGRNFVDSGCSRKTSESHSCFSSEPCKMANECPHFTQSICPQPKCENTALSRFDKLCPCNSPQPAPCGCNRNCQPTTSCAHFTTHCPYRRDGGGKTNNKNNRFDNYDLFHNLVVKSGEDSDSNQPRRFEKPNPVNIDKSKYEDKEPYAYRQVKVIVDESKARTLQDSYRSFGYSERKKRDIEDQAFKPFWQMDEYNQRKSPELKYIKYTTLANKKFRKTQKTTHISRASTITETITIKPKHKSTVRDQYRGRVTEKYLSFDELMHLRKLSTAVPLESDARRQADQTTKESTEASTESPTNVTANTPFIRQKHCTRKLTCTWTGSMGGYANNPNNGNNGANGMMDVGSRTPPGYVEGCTRTSTCTRIYMNRNKMATLSEATDDGATSSGHPEVNPEDEDYCERRSLNIRRRNLNSDTVMSKHVKPKSVSMELPVLSAKIDDVVTRIQSNNDNNKEAQEDSSTDRWRMECNGINCNAKDINVPINADTNVNHRSKKNIKSYKCLCNGTKFVKQMSYWTIKLNYCVTWLFYHMCFLRFLLS